MDVGGLRGSVTKVETQFIACGIGLLELELESLILLPTYLLTYLPTYLPTYSQHPYLYACANLAKHQLVSYYRTYPFIG